jgi:hypothetical protein
MCETIYGIYGKVYVRPYVREPHDWVRVVRQENMAMGPEGPETKNGCASEYQQQITRPGQTRPGLM